MTIVDEQDFNRYAREGTAQTATDELRRSLRAGEQKAQAHCHRTIALVDSDADPTTRRFRPLNSTVCYVDDFADDAGLVVTNDGVTVSSDDYDLDPVNGRDDAGNVVPYTKLTLHSGSWVCNGRPTVGLTTDQWGWASIPEAIKEAICIFADNVADQRNIRAGVAGFGVDGVVRARVTTDPVGLLQDFVRYDRVRLA